MSKLKQFFTRDKLIAFGVHLGLSLLVFLTLLFIILNYWYPYPLFTTDGGWTVLRIIVLVDVVLGPVLTLVVYRKGKPRLRLDMSLIILMQIAALIGGGWVTYRERPLFVAAIEGELVPAAASLYTLRNDDLGILDRFGETNTRIIVIDLPQDPLPRSEILAQAMRDGLPLYDYPDLFRKPRPSDLRPRKGEPLTLEKLAARDDAAAHEVRAFVAKYPDADSRFLFVPMRTRFALWVAAVERDTLQLADVLDIPVAAEI